MLKLIDVKDIKISLHARDRFAKRVLKCEPDAEVNDIIRQYLPSKLIDVMYHKLQTKGVTFVIRNRVLTTVMKGDKNV